MTFWELLILSVGLAMDAFALSLCKGLAAGHPTKGQCISAGLYFGCFQALMPLLGYALSFEFSDQISSLDHWIAFGVLAIIGIRMLTDARRGDDLTDASFRPSSMIPAALAASIDALAVGAGFALLHIPPLSAALCIGIVTFGLCALGTGLGSGLGSIVRARAQRLGGCVLILIGFKILADHLLHT